MLGLDTGFFVELMRGRPTAKCIWKELIDGQEEAVVSCLTLFELDRLTLKGAIERGEVLQDAIPAVCRLEWLECTDIIHRGARLSHGLGLPCVDSLILASFEAAAATAIYTTDSHFAAYKRGGVKIVILQVTA